MKAKTPESILKDIFGYDQFRPLQREVIKNVLDKRDTLAIMPTGGGKSLCYQIPALLLDGLTVVVSPLIALMNDQVGQLDQNGVPAVFLNSSLSSEEYQDNMRRVRSGEVRLLYVAPETLLTPRLFALLDSLKVDCLTIDEAHCISEWGHDFRPEYRQLEGVRKRYPKAVCLALTATATPQVRADICQHLRIAADNEFVASFDRPNLLIEVLPKNDPLGQTLQFLQRYPGQSGIIYCFSRKQVDDLTAALRRQKYSVRAYHAGLSDDERKQNQDLFIRDDVQIIVATIAFGLGINKPNVRFVVHYDLPKSIESYYQEIGRAGRDGLPAHCLLLYNYGDSQKQRYFIDQKQDLEREVALRQLSMLTHYAESGGCRRVLLLEHFGETYAAANCANCDNCLAGQKEEADITVPAQKFLSCVVRTGERFGAAHIVDVLLGSKNEKVLKFNHQTLSTYGIGSEFSRKQWEQIGRQLLQKALLAKDDEYGGLTLTEAGRKVLRAKETILGVLPAADAPTSAAKRKGEAAYDGVLFDRLRKRRKELADAAHVPPYMIFSDRSLADMAANTPRTREAMLAVNGVGEVKLKHYGEAFMEIIRQYCQEKGISARPKAPAARRTAPRLSSEETAEKTGAVPRHVVVAQAFNAGQTLAGLVEQYIVRPITILDHLTQYTQEGGVLRASDELQQMVALPPELQASTLAAFAELGPEKLRPVYDRLNGLVNYDELKILRLIFLSQPR